MTDIYAVGIEHWNPEVRIRGVDKVVDVGVIRERLHHTERNQTGCIMLHEAAGCTESGIFDVLEDSGS